jgi:pre-mRNA-processing factor 40
MVTDRRTADIDRDALGLIFNRLYEKVLKRNEEEKHAADRHARRMVDALRSRIKHLHPPVRSSDTWDQVRARVEKTEEFRALESDEVRKTAFEKVIKRLKEKDEDGDRERRPRRRDDDRDLRNGHSGRPEGRRGRVSRTPEVDAYQAERRKAMADREKSYRKSGNLGLSPPPSLSHRDRDRDLERRDRDDRHGRLERSPGPRRLSHYERERRDREEERERMYRTRGDPRGNRDELNYGEESRSVTGSERRRRRGGESDGDSDGSARRSSKRHRWDPKDSREKRKSKTPDEKPAAAELTGVHSGSEEGEIEED